MPYKCMVSSYLRQFENYMILSRILGDYIKLVPGRVYQCGLCCYCNICHLGSAIPGFREILNSEVLNCVGTDFHFELTDENNIEGVKNREEELVSFLNSLQYYSREEQCNFINLYLQALNEKPKTNI